MAESAQAHESTATFQETSGVISQLAQYRVRLVDDFAVTPRKAKLPKSMVMAPLKTYPEIVKIDAALATLHGPAAPVSPYGE